MALVHHILCNDCAEDGGYVEFGGIPRLRKRLRAAGWFAGMEPLRRKKVDLCPRCRLAVERKLGKPLVTG